MGGFGGGASDRAEGRQRRGRARGPMSASAIPVLPGRPFVGLVPALRRDVPSVLERAHRSLGDVVRLGLPSRRPLVALAHPDAVRHVLVAAAERYGRSPFHDRLKIALGEGLLTSEPPLWTQRRRAIQPTFQARSLKAYWPAMQEEGERLAARWADAGTAIVEANAALTDLTLAVAARALFGSGDDHGELARAVETLRATLAPRMFALVDPPPWLPTPGQRRLRAAVAGFDRCAERLVAAADGARETVVGRLAAVGLAGTALRDEVITLFVAGHETSAAGLAWALRLTAPEPEVQARIAAEGASLEDAPDDELMARLPYTRAVVEETLRLYPPGAWSARRVLADDEVQGFRLPAGAVVIVSPLVTQRDARWWPDPLVFRPERFLAAAPKPRPGAYFPFGAGPRTCIGLQFALDEMTLALAALLARVRIELVEPEAVRAQSAITLRPAPRLLVRVRPR